MSELFSKKLTEALDRSGKRQSEVAALVGITPPYLSDLKKGKKSRPSHEVVKSLAQVLGVEVSWLLASEAGPLAPIVAEDPSAYRSKPLAADALRDETLLKARELNESLEPAVERVIKRALRRLDSLFATAAANDGAMQAGILRMSHEAIDDFAEEIRELRAQQRINL